jgi:hypothetical protein
MPRGKNTVMAVFCTETNMRLGTVRWNPKGETSKEDLTKKIKKYKIKKYNPKLKKMVSVKLSEEKK